MSKKAIEEILASLLKKQKNRRKAVKRTRQWKKTNPEQATAQSVRGKARWRKRHPDKAHAEWVSLRDRWTKANEGRDPFDGTPKDCPSCGETKPRTSENWNKNRGRKDGLDGTCRVCTSKRRTRKGGKP